MPSSTITKKDDYTITITTPIEVDKTLADIEDEISRITDTKAAYETSSAAVTAGYQSQIDDLTSLKDTAISLGVIPE